MDGRADQPGLKMVCSRGRSGEEAGRTNERRKHLPERSSPEDISRLI